MIKKGRMTFPFTAALLLAIALLGACGNKAAPFLGKKQEPVSVEITRVAVTPGEVRLTFRVPKENFRLGREEEPWSIARVLRRDAENPELAYEERSVVREAEGFTFGKLRTIVDAGTAGRSYIYTVEMRKEESGQLAESDPVTARVEEVPGLAGELSADGREGAITVTWPPPAGEGEYLYQVYRRERDGEASSRVNPEPVTGTRYVDTAIGEGTTYCYRVRTYRREGIVEGEGPLSPESCARAVDRTAPPAPTGLVASLAGGKASLTWFTVDAGDLFGYNVYRSRNDGPFEKINLILVERARFTDGDLESGSTYRYRVTAVDNAERPNESSFSNIVSVSVP